MNWGNHPKRTLQRTSCKIIIMQQGGYDARAVTMTFWHDGAQIWQGITTSRLSADLCNRNGRVKTGVRLL